jgi:hypothetical protein
LPILDTVYAKGHYNIKCTHPTTIELTKENYLTKRGNCILGINATKSCIDLSSALKKRIKNGEKINILLKSEGLTDSFYGYGSSKLELTSNNDIVFRKSDYICGRTVLINCTKSSNEINKDLIMKLMNKNVTITTIFYTEDL